MIRDLNVFTWKLLRAAARSPVPLTGRQLRITPTRFTKSGEFLDELVTDGLLEVSGVQPDSTPKHQTPKPVQFRTLYKLTQKGLDAAEYGEYEKPTARELAAMAGAQRADPANKTAVKGAKGTKGTKKKK